MKKAKFLAIFSILLAMGMTACGGKPATPSSNPSSQPDQSQPSSQGGGEQSSQGGGEQSSQGGGDSSAHTHEFGEWAHIANPTYTELGSDERVCACGEKEQRDVNTLPFDVDAESEVVKLNGDSKKVSQFTYNNGAAKVAAVPMKQMSGIFKTEAVEGETEKWTIGDNANKSAGNTYKLDQGVAILFKVNVSAAIDNAFISIGAKYSNERARHFANEGDRTDEDTNGDNPESDAFRYYTKVNDGEFQAIGFNSYMSEIFGDGKSVCYMPLGKFNLKAGENLIYVRQGKLGYRVTLEGFLYVALGNATITGEDPAPVGDVAGTYPTFKWGDALQEDLSEVLDGEKFKASSSYVLKVKNVPAAGTYTITLPIKGSDGNGDRVMNGSSHKGQGFTLSSNDDVAGVFYGNGKTYAEFLGDDQTVWVDVLFGEVTLNEGVNTITIKTDSNGYRLSINVNSNITLAAKA